MSKFCGKKLRKVRQNYGLTLPELASKTGLSKGLLSKLENHPDANPTISTLLKLADFMHVNINRFLTK